MKKYTRSNLKKDYLLNDNDYFPSDYYDINEYHKKHREEGYDELNYSYIETYEVNRILGTKYKRAISRKYHEYLNIDMNSFYSKEKKREIKLQKLFKEYICFKQPIFGDLVNLS